MRTWSTSTYFYVYKRRAVRKAKLLHRISRGSFLRGWIAQDIHYMPWVWHIPCTRSTMGWAGARANAEAQWSWFRLADRPFQHISVGLMDLAPIKVRFWRWIAFGWNQTEYNSKCALRESRSELRNKAPKLRLTHQALSACKVPCHCFILHVHLESVVGVINC